MFTKISEILKSLIALVLLVFAVSAHAKEANARLQTSAMEKKITIFLIIIRSWRNLILNKNK